jgi:hypothetical protein
MFGTTLFVIASNDAENNPDCSVVMFSLAGLWRDTTVNVIGLMGDATGHAMGNAKNHSSYEIWFFF